MQTQSDAGGFFTLPVPGLLLLPALNPFLCAEMGDSMTITFNYCDLMCLMCIQ